MPRILNFDADGFYIFGEDVHNVPEGTPITENQYLAGDGEETPFYLPKLVDGQLVEGLTPEEIAERENQVPEVPKDPVYEKLETIEQQMQAGNLTTFEVLATMYEDMGTGSITQFEVMATMYEEILNLRAEVEALKGATT